MKRSIMIGFLLLAGGLCLHGNQFSDQRLTLRIQKIDSRDQKILNGAWFTLFAGEDEIVKDLQNKECIGVTDGDEGITWQIMYRKNMYLREIKAPAGYALHREKILIPLPGYENFSMEKPLEVKVKDEQIEVPHFGTWKHVPAGIVAISSLILIICMQKHGNLLKE